MAQGNGRETLTAKVSMESAAGWKCFCRENGISLTAFLEVAGLRLAEETYPPKVGERAQMVEEARMVDMERRARK